MFQEFARRVPGVPLLANMTEFGKTPVLHPIRVRGDGLSQMVIWPVSSLRAANKAQQICIAALKRDGSTHKMLDQMQTAPSSTQRSVSTTMRPSMHRSSETIVPESDARRGEQFRYLAGPKWNSLKRRYGERHPIVLTEITVDLLNPSWFFGLRSARS